MIKLETPFNYQGRTHDAGEVIRLPEELEKKMIEVGTAVKHEEVKESILPEELEKEMIEVETAVKHEVVEESLPEENNKSGKTSKTTKRTKDEE
jgi:hypothetical protein